MKYSVITFGCRVNQADSLGFEEHLRSSGAVAAPPEQADLVVVNTCSVTATADQGARQTIRRVARDNPHARIVVTGCYATRRPDEVRELPNVVQVIANDDKPELVRRLVASAVIPVGSIRLHPSTGSGCPDRVEGQGDVTTADRFGAGEGSCGAPIEPGVAGRTAFTLRVQTGCAEPCAYCIIPTTRGRPRSVPVETVLAEVNRVASAGFKEIALTGVHLGSYGRDLTPASSLIELLQRLDGRPQSADRAEPDVRGSGSVRLQPDPGESGRVRLQPDLIFRISSLEPMDCTREVVDLVAASERFAPHFHLPLQHASNRVLARMHRPYTIEQYASLVADIRARIPHASIGSDLIVGFPGETDEEFEELAAYLERSPLTHLHVFPYSDRSGTEAAKMSGKVAGAVIRGRARRVREIGQRLTSTFRHAQLGAVYRALTIDDGSLAVTGNYLKVKIPPRHARNEWVTVKVTDAGETMRGEIW